MDMSYLAVQLTIAVICGIAGNILIPREVPGKFFGLVLIGFLGVWLGEWGYRLLRTQFNLDLPLLEWQLGNVPIIPAIIGSAIVLYVLTTFLKWGRYSK